MSKSYGQFCPVATASEIIGERWTPLVIRELVSGSDTFNDIRMGLARMSPSLLSTRLKTLEKAGIIVRETQGQHVRYKLTTAGEELRPVIMALGVWGHRWARSDMSRSHLDPGYLMWDIRRRLNTDTFPETRVVLLFEFSDYMAKLRRWWLVINKDEVDLCRTDPGYDIDLKIVSKLKTLVQVWMGDMALAQALKAEQVALTGDKRLKTTMKHWFSLSVVASIKRDR